MIAFDDPLYARYFEARRQLDYFSAQSSTIFRPPDIARRIMTCNAAVPAYVVAAEEYLAKFKTDHSTARAPNDP